MNAMELETMVFRVSVCLSVCTFVHANLYYKRILRRRSRGQQIIKTFYLFVQVTLAEQEIILKQKNKAAEELILVVGAESDKVSKEKAFGIIIFCIIYLYVYAYVCMYEFFVVCYAYTVFIHTSTQFRTLKKSTNY